MAIETRPKAVCGDASSHLMDADSEIFAVHAAQTGSEQAWRHRFERHFDAVCRFCVALAGGRRDLAGEVAHQVFIIAPRRINRFDPDLATFPAWLLGNAGFSGVFL